MQLLTSMENYPKIGVNIFLIKDGKILLGKRMKKTGYETWSLPGGHFEWGEKLEDCARRELEEETGIVCGNLEFLHLVNDPREDCHYVHINFLAKSWEGEPKLTEPENFSEWSWFDLNNLPDPVFIGHQKFLKAFKDKIFFVD